MRRNQECLLIVFLLFLVSRPGAALHLSWASGGGDRSFSTAARCTLVVTAGPEEPTLPEEWRLLWVADNLPALPVVLDSAVTGDGVAQGGGFENLSVAEAAGNTVATRLWSLGPGRASSARSILDLPVGSAGKFQVVSLAPVSGESKATFIARSEIVTFNGGVDAPLGPAVLGATSSHATSRLRVTALGVGLRGSRAAAVTAPDTSWQVPLGILEQTDTTVTAEAEVSAPLPASVVRLEGATIAASPATFAADEVTVESTVMTSSSFYFDPNPKVQPKDFAFYYNTVPNPWRGLFHLIYIRRIQGLPEALNETTFGHAWSNDLTTWSVDTVAFTVGGSGWDAGHVWAPTLIQNGDLYWMYYTGVDAAGNQSIGFATTPLLDGANTAWTRQSSPAFEAPDAEWVDHLHSQFSGFQFRDPFVFPDPYNVGLYLMLYVAEDSLNAPHNAVGLARSLPGSLSQWEDRGYYRITDFAHAYASYDESPHAFPVAGTSSGWRIMYTSGQGSPTQRIDFVAANAGVSVSDTTLSHWQGRVHLYNYLGGDSTVVGWSGTEHLKAGKVEYLAAYGASGGRQGIAITRMNWLGNNFSLAPPSTADADDGDGSSGSVSFSHAGLSPNANRVRLRLDLPAARTVRVAVYDLMGRRLATLLDGPAPRGETTLDWDGRARSGSPVASGVYFARMTSGDLAQVVRIPLVR